MSPAGEPGADQRGSALVMAVLVLFVLSSLGIGLLFLTQLEMQMGSEDARSKQAFYLAEAGLEVARESLRLGGATADAMLATAAGPDGEIDFDPDTLQVEFDAVGNVTGLSGFDDDVPLVDTTALGEGVYAAFLTNDPAETGGAHQSNDTNERLTVTAVGVGPVHKVEVAQAIVERDSFPPLPAAITMPGPSPAFYGGDWPNKVMTGNDCFGSGLPGLDMPVLGVIGPLAEQDAEAGVVAPLSYTQGYAPNVEYGVDTVDDVTASINPLWLDCNYLLELAARVRAQADIVGDASTPLAELQAAGNDATIFLEGDYATTENWSGGGLLWVTGTLDIRWGFDWDGTIFVIGTGNLQGIGYEATYQGAVVVANIAGPDGVLWTADDCSGADGVLGTADDGFDVATFHISDPGETDLSYCQSSIDAVSRRFPFAVTQFRQR